MSLKTVTKDLYHHILCTVPIMETSIIALSSAQKLQNLPRNKPFPCHSSLNVNQNSTLQTLSTYKSLLQQTNPTTPSQTLMDLEPAPPPTRKTSKETIPFFSEDDLSASTSTSTVSTDSSLVNSWHKKSFAFALRKQPLETTNIKAYMTAWAQHKPNSNQDWLPYDTILTSNNPFMALSPYRLLCHTSYSNLISILVNSVRREMADMYVFVLPSLMQSSANPLEREECSQFKEWWNGFAQYLFAVLMTVARILDTLDKSSDIQVAKLHKLKRTDVKREYNRCLERLRITSEIPMRTMQHKVTMLLDSRSSQALLAVEEMWACLANFILQTLDDSFNVARSIERFSKKTMPEGLQERVLQSMLNPPRFLPSSAVADFEANIIVALTRWLQNEAMLMKFVNTFFKRRTVAKLDAYFARYDVIRNISKFQFDRSPSEPPQRTGYTPSKVTFAMPP